MFRTLRITGACALVCLALGLTHASRKGGRADPGASERTGITNCESHRDQRPRIAELLKIIRGLATTVHDEAAIVGAIRELGCLRAKEAAADLSEKLDFEWRDHRKMYLRYEMPAPEDEYPAIRALVTIGPFALPAIIHALASRERSEEFRWNAIYAIGGITDADAYKGITWRILFLASERETDPHRRERLREVAEKVVPRSVEKRREFFESVLERIKNPVNQTKWRSSVVEGVVELAEDRPWEVAEDLVSLLDFHVTGLALIEGAPLEAQYPAVKALIQAGPLALPVLVEAANAPGLSEQARSNAVYAIRHIAEDYETTRALLRLLSPEHLKKAERLKELIDKTPASKPRL